MGNNFNRRDFLTLAAGTALSSAVPAALDEVQPNGQALPSPAPQAGAKNLILFLPDELRADSLACYGNPVTKTPNFDRLAQQGTRFSNCHVQYPICGPSRCSMLTGWPTSMRGHRSQYYHLRRDEPNMFRYLKQAGYDVFWVGKNDALGQECFHDSVTEWVEEPLFPSIDRSANVSNATMQMTPGESDRTKTTDYACIQQAIKWLKRREADRPFCIFIASWEPHPPYRAPAEFATMYKAIDLPPLIPPNLPKKPDFHGLIRESRDLTRTSDAELRQVRATYYGQVSYTDWLLGELMEAVERTNRSHDTALFVASDHGDYAGDYGLIEKWPSDLASCLTHVPLIGRIPGQAQGHVAQDMVELYDIMPTFLDLAGTRATHTNFARSLLTQMQGGPGDPDRAAFTEGGMNIYEPQAWENSWPGPFYRARIEMPQQHPESISRSAAVKTSTHTFIRRPQGLSELYDRTSDPNETKNLIDEPHQAEVRQRLQMRILDWYINTTGVPQGERDNGATMPAYTTQPDNLEHNSTKSTRQILDS